MSEPPKWLELLLIIAFWLLAVVVRIAFPAGFVADFVGFAVSAFTGIALIDVFRSIGKHEKLPIAVATIVLSLILKLICSAIVGLVIAIVLAGPA